MMLHNHIGDGKKLHFLYIYMDLTFFSFGMGGEELALVTMGRVWDKVRVPSLGLASKKPPTDLYMLGDHDWYMVELQGGKFKYF